MLTKEDVPGVLGVHGTSERALALAIALIRSDRGTSIRIMGRDMEMNVWVYKRGREYPVYSAYTVFTTERTACGV